MKSILIILTFLFVRCHSFVTLSLDEIKKNVVNDFLSDTTQSYPEKSKEILNPEGQKLDRLLSESSLLKYEKAENEALWASPTLQDKLVLIKEANIFDNLLNSSSKLNTIYQDNFIDGLYIKPGSLTSTSKYERDVSEDETNSVGNEAEHLARMRCFFEELCRKYHSMLSKLSIEHNHYPSSDSNEPKKISIF